MPSARRRTRTPKSDTESQGPEASPSAHPDFDPTPPRTPDELHAWLVTHLDLRVAREPMLPEHHAPFEYLVHSFFEGKAFDTAPSVENTPTTTPLPRDCVVWANRGGGKTFLGAVATLLDLLYKPGIEIRVLGGSLDQSRRMHTHLRRLLDPRKHPALADQIDGTLTDKRLILKNGSELELLAQSQASVRGTRVQKLRCDEVELFKREVWEAAQLVTRSKRCGEFDVPGTIECLSTMHLPHGLMHSLVNDCNAGTRTLFRWGVLDVLSTCGPEHACTSDTGKPCVLFEECQGKAKVRSETAAGHIRVSDAIVMKSRVSRYTWASEMLCTHPRRSDSVLPEFDPAVHVFDADPPLGKGSRVLAGMDFGYRAPTVVVFAILDASGVLWIVDERSEAMVVLAEHIDAIKKGKGHRESPWPAPEWVGADPAGHMGDGQTGMSHIDAMRESGIVVRSRPMRILDGLEMLRARLRPASDTPDDPRPRLFVHRRCTTLIESLERYHFPTDKPESMVPVKDGHDHAVDALRYLIQCLDKPFKMRPVNYGEG